jgi:translocation and assembly module TamB
VSDISPFQAIQLEQSLRRFSGKGGGGLDPLGALRSATGLDDLSVESTADEGTTVGAGKYITDKVYIGVQHGQSEASGAASIKVDITPNIAVDSRVGQDSQGGAGVSWHWDY